MRPGSKVEYTTTQRQIKGGSAIDVDIKEQLAFVQFINNGKDTKLIGITDKGNIREADLTECKVVEPQSSAIFG